MSLAEDGSTPPVARSASKSTSATLGSASFSPPSGSLLVAMFVNAYYTRPGSQPTLTITDSKGGTWIVLKALPGNASSAYDQATFAVQYLSSAPGSMTVTGTRSSAAAGDMTLAVRVLSGANASQTGAVAFTAYSGTASHLSQAITTTVAGSQVYAVAGIANSEVPTPVAGTTEIDVWSDAGNVTENCIAMLTSLTGTPGATSIGWTRSAVLSEDQVVIAVEILPDAGPFTPTVDAGTAANTVGGTTFTRTAGESDGGATITARAWTIVSGPAGSGTTIGTAAALSWTPTVLGAYTLEYSATNSVGTGTSDVVITVTATPTSMLWAGTQTAASGSWSGTANAVGSGTGDYATATLSSSGAVGSLEAAGFGGQAAVGAGVVTRVEVTVRHSETSLAQVASVTAQIYIGATPVGSPQALTPSLTDIEETISVTGPSFADLADLRVRVVVTRV